MYMYAGLDVLSASQLPLDKMVFQMRSGNERFNISCQPYPAILDASTILSGHAQDFKLPGN
jgi:hypothetical protein